jgi:nicotinamide riboside kinase
MNDKEIEEAAENYNDDFQIKSGSKPPYIKNQHIMNHFIEGAKWQAERMYSEEEVIDLLQKMNDWPTICEGRSDIEEWFEQFKKKIKYEDSSRIIG